MATQSITPTRKSNAQSRAHKELARAEKLLIHHIVWESDPAKIAKAEALVVRRHNAWKATQR